MEGKRQTPKQIVHRLRGPTTSWLREPSRRIIDPVRNTIHLAALESVFPGCTDLSLPAAEPSYIARP